MGEELALIETGPTKSLPFIIAGIRELGFDPADISYIIISHIHLDHGGGAAVLLKEMPKAKVVVHEKGVRHMVEPSKLIKSSKMVFGDVLYELYGEILPIERGRIMPVSGGEIIDLGKNQKLKIINAPGHSNHHICIYSEKDKGLFTGEAAGVYLPDSETLIPSSPPPDFNPDIAIETIKGLSNLDLRFLMFSHSGVTEKVNRALNTAAVWLMKWKKNISEMMSKDLSVEEITETLREDVKKVLGSNREKELSYQWIMEQIIPACAMGYINYFKKNNLQVFPISLKGNRIKKSTPLFKQAEKRN
ncbi:MAG: MBL fold metallo-hydrolase [Syntrophales bacterium]